MEQRLILALVLSAIVMVASQYLLGTGVPQNQPEPGAAGVEQTANPDEPSTLSNSPDAAAAAAAALAELNLNAGCEDDPGGDGSLSNDLFSASLAKCGGRIRSFLLSEYKETNEPGSPALDFISAVKSNLPLAVSWRTVAGAFHDGSVMYAIEQRSPTELVLSGTVEGENRTQITKHLKAAQGSYLIEYEVTVRGADVSWIGLSWTRQLPEKDGRFVIEGPAAFIDDDLMAHRAMKLDEPKVVDGTASWAGYADHYFLAAYIPEPRPTRIQVDGRIVGLNGQSTAWMPADGGTVSTTLFVGPKKVWLLRDIGHNLEEAVDLGWFAIIARPLLEALLWLHKIIGNFGWAIIVLTIAIRVVFYPINKRQALAMKGMQKVQPEMQRLQEKYKDDRDKLQMEMMELYRRHKVNPIAGCVPMLLQIPVFIGLYNALMQAIELRHAPFLGWITDLSQPDRLGALPLPFVAPPGIPVLTLMMGASMILQQRMTPAVGDATQQRMMMFLPVVFTVMFVNFPAGLVLYWFANNILSIGQQYMNNRATT